MLVSRRSLKLFLTLLFITLYLWSIKRPNAEHPRDKYYQLVPWRWPTRVENYNFEVLASERACADGSIERFNSPGMPPNIPRTVHFTWGLKGDGEFNFAVYLAIRAALLSIRPDVLKVHYTRIARDNIWFRQLEANITLVQHDPAEYLDAAGFGADGHRKNWDVAHIADILRLQILQTEGGIYLDSDVYALRSFDKILQGARDVVMAHEGGNRFGMANAVIVAKKGASFVNRWLKEYAGFDEQDWNYHSVVLPKKLATEHLKEICAMSPTAFFWPLWTESHIDYMHTPLSKIEAQEVKARIAKYGGVLYEDQLVYHAWNHGSYEQYVKRLTPEIMRSEDTRFNILMRPFLPDD